MLLLIALEIGTPDTEAGVPSVDKFTHSLRVERRIYVSFGWPLYIYTYMDSDHSQYGTYQANVHPHGLTAPAKQYFCALNSSMNATLVWLPLPNIELRQISERTYLLYAHKHVRGKTLPFPIRSIFMLLVFSCCWRGNINIQTTNWHSVTTRSS
jgi:hypothetical protein